MDRARNRSHTRPACDANPRSFRSHTRPACDANPQWRAGEPPAATSTSKRRARFLLCATLLCVTFLGPSTATANDNVNEGLRLFRQGSYEAAAQAFASAAKESPGDERIVFDQGCAANAREDYESARSHFLGSALARDKNLSAMSHYNLGCLAANLATAEFTDDPSEANTQQRSAGLQQLAEAARHYRDCLGIDPNHTNARHNLETIRLWIKHMQAIWDEKDKQKKENEDQEKQQSMLELLKVIEERQIAVHDGTYAMARQDDQSPTQSEAFADQQLELVGEIEKLTAKIREELAPPAGSAPQSNTPQPNATSNSAPDAEHAIEALTGLAAQAEEDMSDAESSLRRGDPVGALHPQREALANLGDFYLAISPFADMLQRSIQQEEKLVSDTQQEISDRQDDEHDALPDGKQLAWRQNRVHDWASMLSEKAARELEQTPTLAELEQMQTEDQANPGPTQQSGRPAPTPEENEEERESLEGLRTALERAVNLGPTVVDLTDEAAKALRKDEPAEAWPKEQEALRLLKEIAETLPKQNNQQQDHQQQNQNQNQDENNQGQSPQDQSDQQQNQDQQNKDEQNKDEQNKDEQNKDNEDEQQEGQDEQDQQQQDDQQQPSENAPESRPGFTRQQAEAILQRARQREREHRRHREQMRKVLARDANVKKDW